MKFPLDIKTCMTNYFLYFFFYPICLQGIIFSGSRLKFLRCSVFSGCVCGDVCVVSIDDYIARNQAEVSPSLSSTSFEVLLSLGGGWGDHHVIFHVKQGLVWLQVGQLGSIRIKKIWADFTFYGLNNFHMRRELTLDKGWLKAKFG